MVGGSLIGEPDVMGVTRTPMFHTDFTVTGRGSFPFDMLRYDRCFPVDGGSASNLGRSGSFNTPQHDLPVVILRHVHADKEWAPTFGRWASFGWGVTQVHPTRKG